MNEKSKLINKLARTPTFADELNIDLSTKKDQEYFKWFLASILYGARINKTIARNTYRTFKKNKLLQPRKILKAGWRFLVNPIMREGGYVRYDGRKSTQILTVCEQLLKKYQGSLTKLHKMAKNSKHLEQLLQEFYGVGPITTNIFLRELRPYWSKANPSPLPLVRKKAKQLGIKLSSYKMKAKSFVKIEAGLIRMKKKPR